MGGFSRNLGYEAWDNANGRNRNNDDRYRRCRDGEIPEFTHARIHEFKRFKVT